MWTFKPCLRHLQRHAWPGPDFQSSPLRLLYWIIGLDGYHHRRLMLPRMYRRRRLGLVARVSSCLMCLPASVGMVMVRYQGTPDLLAPHYERLSCSLYATIYMYACSRIYMRTSCTPCLLLYAGYDRHHRSLVPPRSQQAGSSRSRTTLKQVRERSDLSSACTPLLLTGREHLEGELTNMHDG